MFDSGDSEWLSMREGVDGDYLDLTGPSSSVQVRRIVELALAVSPSVWHMGGAFPWVRFGRSLYVLVDYASEGEGTARVGVADHDEHASRRHAIAECLREAFQRHTAWATIHSRDSV